jgi:hypothetical protein
MKKTTLLLNLLFLTYLSAPGQTWSSLGSGLNGVVHAIINHNNNVLVGGTFNNAGGSLANNLAEWNGSSWSTFSSGAGGSYSGVWALAVYNGNIYAGGSDFNNSSPYENLIEWNGSSWVVPGSGMTGANTIYALCVFNNILYSTSLYIPFGAEWNGSTWTSIPGGLASGIACFINYNNNLIAGGNFFHDNNTCPGNHIVQINSNSLDSLGHGTNGTGVWSLTEYNGVLIAGGNFDSAGYVPSHCIAQWNGTTWSPLGSGFNNTVLALTEYNGLLIAGGVFDSTGGIRVNHIAQWNGTSWAPIDIGMNGPVYTLAVVNNTLYAGGVFDSAGGNRIIGIAQLSGSLGVNQVLAQKRHLNVYPNPSNGIFNLTINESLMNYTIEIDNVLGEVVYQSLVKPANGANVEINLSKQNAGIYLYRVVSPQGQTIDCGKLLVN